MAHNNVKILQPAAQLSRADPGCCLGVQRVRTRCNGKCRKSRKACLWNELIDAFSVIDECWDPQLFAHLIRNHRSQGRGMGRIVIVAVLHECLINDVSAGHQVSAASASGNNNAQIFRPNMLFGKEVPNRLLTQVHLVENTLHTCDSRPVYVKIPFTDIDTVLIIRNLGGGGTGIEHQDLVHFPSPCHLEKCSTA